MASMHSVSEDASWPNARRLYLMKVMSTIRSYVVLTKPKIQFMLLFTAYCAMLLAYHGIPSAKVTIFTLVGLGLSGAGSAAVNMWYDSDIDVLMQRTSHRPIPNGEVRATSALVYGVILVAISFVGLWVWVNALTAIMSLSGAIYYAVFYTAWLKRRTPQNIVIGGGAGAFPPLVGWAAVTGHLSLSAIMMFAIVFLWTPPHFWALALYKNDDYTRAGIPMMPVVRGAEATKRQSLIYAVVLGIVAVGFDFIGHLGLTYEIVAIVVNVIFLAFNVRLYFERDGSMTWAKRTFVASIAYLPILFLAMVV